MGKRLQTLGTGVLPVPPPCIYNQERTEKRTIMETKAIGIFNNKGGVGKSTTVINLAYCMQKQDKKVLVVDCDTQENCFSFFLTGQMQSAVLPTEYENIHHTTWNRFTTLTDEDVQGYDYVLFDLPPTITQEVKTVLQICDAVYVPTMLGEFEISGLKRVTDTIHSVGTKLGGIFITMYQAQNDAELMKDVRTVLQNRLMQTVIPYSKTVRESQKSGLPIEAYFEARKVPKVQSSYKIVNAYHALANEIMEGLA